MILRVLLALLLALLTSLIVSLLRYSLYTILVVPELPKLDQNKWWGEDTRPNHEDKSIRPFKIEFNDSMINDLKLRITNRRPLTKPLQGINSEYGMNTIYLTEVLEYWLCKYEFKKRAAMLNRFNHYKTRIQGLDIHYIRQRPMTTDGLKVLPILLIHGWPSSSKEFDKIIPRLIKPRKGYKFTFDVVAVDLPGFGFSEGTTKPGLNTVQMGIILHNLMKRIGHNRYYIQGGDWGSQVASHMATMYQRNIIGLHLNMAISSMPISFVKILIGSLFPSSVVKPIYKDRLYPLGNLFSVLLRESGYFHIQATKPDTIGVGLADSPAGLAAYIIEKMGMCTNRDKLNTPHGGIAELDRDDVLDTLTIVWNNNCIVTATRIYAEAVQAPEIGILHRIPTYVPTAVINFKHEVLYQPDSILSDKFYNLVHSTTNNFGGHFAGLQNPKEFAKDIYDAVDQILDFHAKYPN